MPKKLTTILGKLLEAAKYAIKTGIGISKETYQHSKESPAFGSGQGSGASAQGWGKIASNALDAHDKFGHGCMYEDPWKICVVILGMVGYVDDNNNNNIKIYFKYFRRAVPMAPVPLTRSCSTP
jgi:hypothetical protein